MLDRKKVLHLMQDEKFINHFIEQSEEILPGESEYWIAHSKNEPLLHVNADRIKIISLTKERLPFLLQDANKFYKIIIHSFFFPYIDAFLKGLDEAIIVVWMFWGGDGYSYTSNQRRLYLPLTIEYKKNKLSFNVSFFRKYWRLINTYRLLSVQSRKTKKRISRANICATWVKYDYELVRHINPKMLWFNYSYFTAKQLGLENIKIVKPCFNRLWLGNSATDTNNHLDALQFLVEINWQGEILVPLSYGSEEYKDDIIKFGKRHFGSRFIPITEFLPLSEYHQEINKCGVVWMNHIRQQAAGNILAAISLRKMIILNSENTLYKTFIDWGLRIFTKESLQYLHLNEFTEGEKNAEIVLMKMSYKANLETLRKIYDY